jgi:cation transport ATPase
LAPSLFPPAFRNADGSVPIYFEAAAVITALVLLGQILELRAREKTGGAIRAAGGAASFHGFLSTLDKREPSLRM